MNSILSLHYSLLEQEASPKIKDTIIGKKDGKERKERKEILNTINLILNNKLNAIADLSICTKTNETIKTNKSWSLVKKMNALIKDEHYINMNNNSLQIVDFPKQKNGIPIDLDKSRHRNILSIYLDQFWRAGILDNAKITAYNDLVNYIRDLNTIAKEEGSEQGNRQKVFKKTIDADKDKLYTSIRDTLPVAENIVTEKTKVDIEKKDVFDKIFKEKLTKDVKSSLWKTEWSLEFGSSEKNKKWWYDVTLKFTNDAVTSSLPKNITNIVLSDISLLQPGNELSFSEQEFKTGNPSQLGVNIFVKIALTDWKIKGTLSSEPVKPVPADIPASTPAPTSWVEPAPESQFTEQVAKLDDWVKGNNRIGMKWPNEVDKNVQSLQTFLKDLSAKYPNKFKGLSELTSAKNWVDGRFGKNTNKWVRILQTELKKSVQDLRIDGWYGPKTHEALKQWLDKGKNEVGDWKSTKNADREANDSESKYVVDDVHGVMNLDEDELNEDWSEEVIEVNDKSETNKKQNKSDLDKKNNVKPEASKKTTSANLANYPKPTTASSWDIKSPEVKKVEVKTPVAKDSMPSNAPSSNWNLTPKKIVSQPENNPLPTSEFGIWKIIETANDKNKEFNEKYNQLKEQYKTYFKTMWFEEWTGIEIVPDERNNLSKSFNLAFKNKNWKLFRIVNMKINNDWWLRINESMNIFQKDITRTLEDNKTMLNLQYNTSTKKREITKKNNL